MHTSNFLSTAIYEIYFACSLCLRGEILILFSECILSLKTSIYQYLSYYSLFSSDHNTASQKEIFSKTKKYLIKLLSSNPSTGFPYHLKIRESTWSLLWATVCIARTPGTSGQAPMLACKHAASGPCTLLCGKAFPFFRWVWVWIPPPPPSVFPPKATC